MITLITGLPGNGKTLYAIYWVKQRAEKEGRQVYYSGIKDCAVPGWIELPQAEDWPQLPTGCIVLIDEVQRVMRPRMHGSTVPEHVSKLETHRHMGVDLVLITQDPMLLDANARRLVGQHFHVVRKFGTHSATIHEWNAVKEQAPKNRDDSIRHEWRYPKEVFSLYKSAELHTHKRRIPMKVWVLMAIIVGLPVLGYFIYYRIDPRNKAQQQAAPASEMSRPVVGSGGPGGVLTVAQYTARFEPRVQGLAYTAPAYDEVTKPLQAPYPAACIASASRCQCYTQQGTRLATTADLCKSIAEGGFFVAWNQPVVQAVQVNPQPGQQIALAAVPAALPGAISLGGSRPVATVESASVLPDTGKPYDGRGKNLPGKQ